VGLQRVTSHLRLYETAQVLVPGAFGVLAQRAWPDPVTLVLFFVAYGAHVLSVYSYNDYCDHETDSVNPRKDESKSRDWLKYQTLALSVLFVASAGALPLRVGLILFANQLLCMAYSHPRIRLKGRLLGSELAHFVAGSSYFACGVIVAGGRAEHHLLGSLLFGLLYLSGGTFNEILDCRADRRVGLRHLVVLAGRRRVLHLIFGLHYLSFGLLAIYEPTLPVLSSCLVAAAVYTVFLREAVGGIDDLAALVRFRRRYRVLFAVLLTILAVSRTVDLDRQLNTTAPRVGDAHARLTSA